LFAVDSSVQLRLDFVLVSALRTQLSSIEQKRLVAIIHRGEVDLAEIDPGDLLSLRAILWLDLILTAQDVFAVLKDHLHPCGLGMRPLECEWFTPSTSGEFEGAVLKTDGL